MDLNTLHDTMMKSMDPMSSLDYLLSCQSLLKNQDRDGWIKMFAPEMITPEPPMKKMRCSPNVRLFIPLPPCKECESDEVINDVREGSVVCTACGLVQSIQGSVGENVGAATMSVEQMMSGNQYIVHRYSRVVYFRAFLLGIQGQTSPVISAENLQAMRSLSSELEVIDAKSVIKILRQLKLAKKYRRHRESIAVTLSGGAYKPVQIPSGVFLESMRMFLHVENQWNHGGKRQMPGRMVFMSYPYVFYQICHHLGVLQYTGKHHLLKSRTLLAKLHKCYGRLCKKTKMKCDLDVFN